MLRKVPEVLSKSRYLSGLQCPKRLWTEVRVPELLPPLSLATRALFDQGHEVGELAKRLFPGGIEISPDSRQWSVVVEATVRALAQRCPLYEAGFRSEGGACRVDILVPVAEDHWDLYEVKSSTGVKEVHLQDVALQAEVVEGAGLKIRDCYLVHIDNTYVRQGAIDPSGLFNQERVTDEVGHRRELVAARLAAFHEVVGRDSRPEVAIGPHCHDPYDCPLESECWAFLPPTNVFDLVNGRQRAFEWLEQGIIELAEIPTDEKLSDKQSIQLAAVRSGEPWVDREALSSFLSDLRHPISYFDLESFAPAVPLFDGSRPYQQIPFLFSIHRVEAVGERARHFSYHLAEPGMDPRPDFLRAVKSALGEDGTIVAYNAGFERRVLKEAAEAVPEFMSWSLELEQRFVDLLNPFRSFAYHHPDQLGSASLKVVLPAVTGMSYADLEIAEGETASREYLRVMSGNVDPIERIRVLRDLEDYCALDTLGMVAIVDHLEQLTS